MTRTRAATVLPLVLAVALAGGSCSRFSRPRTFTIPSSSMRPTLQPGDRIECTRNAPERVERGDVVVFHGRGTESWPHGKNEPTYVTRVVGLPGETIAGEADGVVTIDGRRLDEPYVAEPATSTFEPRLVPEGHYFVLGDNRDESSDSRFNGPVPHGNVIASCTRIISPRERRGRIPGT